MQSIALSEIPGLGEALHAAKRKQLVTRESSLLSLTYDLCGLQARTITIKDYVLLERMGCPFISKKEPTMEELAIFLWVVSPSFARWSNRRWLSFLQPVASYFYGRKVMKMFGKNIPKTSEPVVIEVFKYIEEMFYDSPPALTSGRESCLCYLTSWFDSLQSEYHFSNEEVWGMGLPELFQRLAAIRLRNSPSMPQFNKGEDSVKLFILRGLRSKEFSMDDLIAGRVNIPSSILN